ncbi:MAG: hypothetical protein Q4C75_03430 [Bergeyella zoohelcum]|nr:hypothetical protein [Bergeyella zoohelcum]
MKKQVLLAAFIALGIGANAQNKQEDIKAIKAMTGCYDVSFNFAETFSPKEGYVKHKDHLSGGLEWIDVVEESPNKIVLQHILIVNPKGKGKHAIVKHWRQDWLYENTDLLLFDKGTHWNYKKLNPKDVKGQWTQIVYQVDDAPRYSGTATWVHVDGKHYWENTTDAPLPRREYTTRNDYNVLDRTNRQEIFKWGWLHDQDNRKVLRVDGKADEVIAEEKGLQYYKKVEDSKCKIAEDYWKEYANFWKVVRKKWDDEMAKKTGLTVKPDVKDTYLYDQLMKLEPNQTKEAIAAIDEYIQ